MTWKTTYLTFPDEATCKNTLEDAFGLNDENKLNVDETLYAIVIQGVLPDRQSAQYDSNGLLTYMAILEGWHMFIGHQADLPSELVPYIISTPSYPQGKFF